MSTTVTAHDLSAELDNLQDYLRLTWCDPRLSIDGCAPFGAGHSGHTYRVALTREGVETEYILRLSPPGLAIKGPADVGRQGRIMAALSAAGLPAPRVVAFDSSGALSGRAFALMERVVGEDWSAFSQRAGHGTTARAAVDALHLLQRLPVAAAGFGPADITTPAQDVARWAPLLDRSPAEVRVQAAPLQEALDGTTPASSAAPSPVLVHGDLHYGNLIFGATGVVAIVDWEIASAGHPLTDLACLAVASLRRRYKPEPNPTGDIDVPLAELVAMLGPGLADAPWFIAAGCLKYAAIIGYNLQLHRSGKRLDPMYEQLQGTMMRLLDDGRHILADGIEGF